MYFRRTKKCQISNAPVISLVFSCVLACVASRVCWSEDGAPTHLLMADASATQENQPMSVSTSSVRVAQEQKSQPLRGEEASNGKAAFDKPDVLSFTLGGGKGKLRLGLDSEVGYWYDGALYASFGQEAQICRFSKIILTLDGSWGAKAEGAQWLFHLDFAPLYSSIRRVKKQERTYSEVDLNGRVIAIDGVNTYRDWYKNLGSRIYYLGDVPLVEAYGGYVTQRHTIKLGRLKNIVGFSDEEVFWGDDGKFAPMQQWLLRDLLTGVVYMYRYHWLEVSAAVFSGNNPMKGYADYLDGVQGPNLKANNTPTLSGALRFYYGPLLGKAYDGFLFVAFQQNKMGSTWEDALEDGKRNASTFACGGKLKRLFPSAFVSAVELFAQYMTYASGLREKGAQNTGDARFLDIQQKGFFLGGSVYLRDDWCISSVYERVDRFDSNLHAWHQFKADNPYRNAKQSSLIGSVRYRFHDAFAVVVSYHKLKNPATMASHILGSRGDERYKVTLQVKL